MCGHAWLRFLTIMLKFYPSTPILNSSTFKYITDIYLLLWKTHNHSEIMDKLNTCNIYMAYLNKWTSILMLLQSSCQFLDYLFCILFLSHMKQFHQGCHSILNTFNCKVWIELMRGAGSVNHRGECMSLC